MTQPTAEPRAHADHPIAEAPCEPRGDSARTPAEICAAVEAILLSVDKPVSVGRLAEALGLIDQGASVCDAAKATIGSAIESLNESYQSTGRAFTIESVAGGHRLMTRPELASVVESFHRSRAPTRLSRAALETMAIVAYKQPITRASLEAIRGVGCGEVLRSLIERKLVTITGRAEELGRPMLYGTTRSFLDVFGLASIRDLPTSGELGPSS